MPTFKITAPDGKTYRVEGPPGSTKEQALAQVQAQVAGPTTPDPMLDPTGTKTEQFLAGAGKGFVDLGRGIKDTAIDAFGSPEQKAAYDAHLQETRRRDAPLMNTGAGIAGNITGSIAAALPSAAIPGVNTLAGGAAVGALLGAAQPTAGDESRLQNVGMGAGFGAGGNLLGRGVARVISPNASAATAPGQRLMAQGVKPTPGQAMGGAARRLEEGAKSVPLLGDVVRGAERASMEQWNKAMGSRVLSHIGKSLPKKMPAGRDMVKYVGDQVSDAYDDVLPKVSAIADNQFKQEIKTLARMVDDLPDGGKQFKDILKRTMLKRMAPNGGMQGRTIKEVDEEMGKLVRQYKKAPGDQGRLGDALQEAQTSLRKMLERQNPDAVDLKNANRAFAELVRIERAAGSVGAKEGIFSPAQLKSAAKALDTSSRKRGFARGTALMQDVAQDAQNVLGATVPDSGTPYRLMAGGLLGGLYDPSILAGVGGMSALYGTNAGRAGLLAAGTARPAMAAPLAQMARQVAGPAAAAGLLPAYR